MCCLYSVAAHLGLTVSPPQFSNRSIVLHGLKGPNNPFWDFAQKRSSGPLIPYPRTCDSCARMGWSTWPGSVVNEWTCCGRQVVPPPARGRKGSKGGKGGKGAAAAGGGRVGGKMGGKVASKEGSKENGKAGGMKTSAKPFATGAVLDKKIVMVKEKLRALEKLRESHPSSGAAKPSRRDQA